MFRFLMTSPDDLLFPGSYLHSCDPPIIHGNLTCDTIFIQHNGLIKIGSGLPPAGMFMLLPPSLCLKKSQYCCIFFPQFGIDYLWTVRNKPLAPTHLSVILAQVMIFVFFNQCFQMLVCMEKGDNTATNSGIFTFLPRNMEASVNPPKL